MRAIQEPDERLSRTQGTLPPLHLGGAVPERGLYISRSADVEAEKLLRKGEYCHILAPRQTGKSSLRNRMRRLLEKGGIRCAVVDLNMIGTDAPAESWYHDLALQIAEELELDADVQAFWARHAGGTSLGRFRRFLREEILEHVPEPVVVFLDEIEVTLSLSFSRDDFFCMLREVHEFRDIDVAWARISFCLLGAVTPADLVGHSQRTPFNIVRPVSLQDFSHEEVKAFLPWLSAAGGNPNALLEAMFAWTGGHPAMMQHLCHELIRSPWDGSTTEQQRVGAAVDALYFQRGRCEDPILLDTDRRFQKKAFTPETRKIIALYRQLLDDKHVVASSGDPLQFSLRVAGLVSERTDAGITRLVVRSPIYARIFNVAWCDDVLEAPHLADRVSAWTDHNRSKDYLLRGKALKDALQWAKRREDLTPDEWKFLQAGQSAAEGDRRIRIVVSAIILVFAVAIPALFVFFRAAIREKATADRAIASLITSEWEEWQNREVLWAGMKAIALRIQQGDVDPDVIRALNDVMSRWQVPVELAGHEGMIHRVEFSTDAAFVLTAGDDGTARLWDGVSGKLSQTLSGHEGAVRAAHFSAGGQNVLTADDGGVVRIWETKTGRLVATTAPLGTKSRGEGQQSEREEIHSVSFSPDGTRVAIVGTGGFAEIVDSQTGDRGVTLKGHSGTVWAAAFSPDDGRRIATVGADRSARVWDATTGQQIVFGRNGNILDGHPDSVQRIVFSNNGKRMATACADGTVGLWNPDTGEHITWLNGAESAVVSLEFSPDDRRLLVAKRDGVTEIWDAIDVKNPPHETLPHGGRLVSAAFLGRSEQVVAIGAKGAVRIWDLHKEPSIVTEFQTRTANVWGAPSRDGSRLVIAAYDGLAQIWSVRSGQYQFPLERHESAISAVAFSPDGRQISTASSDGTVMIWNAGTGRPLRSESKHQGYVTASVFSPDGTTLVTSSADGTVRLFPLSGPPSSSRNLEGHTSFVNTVAFSPEGNRFVSAGDDGAVITWDTQSGGLERKCRPYGGAVARAVFAPDGKRIIAAGADNRARIIDLDGTCTSNPLGTGENSVSSAEFSPSGDVVLMVMHDEGVQVWDARTQSPKLRSVLPATTEKRGPGVTLATFLPGGEEIVVLSGDGRARIWNWQKGNTRNLDALPAVLGPETPRIEAGALSADGDRFVAAGPDRTARVWDVTTGKLLAVLRGHVGDVTAVAISPDGQHVVTGSDDGLAFVFSMDPQWLFTRACDLIQSRNKQSSEQNKQSSEQDNRNSEEEREVCGQTHAR